jgi:hypothetical protein
MRNTFQKTVPTAIGIIAVVLIAGGIIYWGTTSPSLNPKSQKASVVDSLPSGQAAPVHETITAKHQYKNGDHIVAGEVNLPTPCHILTTDARVAESFPEQVTIDFVSTTSADMCAQTVTTARFKVDFKASEQAVIKATWNGQPVTLNLILVSPDENLENFEIYMKG